MLADSGSDRYPPNNGYAKNRYTAGSLSLRRNCEDLCSIMKESLKSKWYFKVLKKYERSPYADAYRLLSSYTRDS